MIYILNTPIVKVNYKKEVLSFYNLQEFEEWKSKHLNQNFESKYLKGLGTSSSKEWKGYLSNVDDNLDLITLDKNDTEIFNLLFSKETGMSDRRKEWLSVEEK